jgi:hypothetical protein
VTKREKLLDQLVSLNTDANIKAAREGLNHINKVIEEMKQHMIDNEKAAEAYSASLNASQQPRTQKKKKPGRKPYLPKEYRKTKKTRANTASTHPL